MFKKNYPLLSFIFFLFSFSFADPINITVFDGEGSGTGWYGVQEDQEISNGCVTGQVWDLEAFILDGSKLSLVGGFDFKNGVADPYYPNYQPRLPRYYSGDIFIDIDGDAKYGTILNGTPNNNVTINTFGWDYVLHLNMDDLTYKVYEIDANSLVETVFFDINDDANPWRWYAGGNLISDNNIIIYETGLSDAETGFLGDFHNKLTVDLSFLDNGTNFTAHYTVQCGNDNIIGKGTVWVPEPAVFSLLGMGLLTLLCAGINKRKK